ncbi:MAG: biotin/lipoate A/B protein ligase family protein [bacterium]
MAIDEALLEALIHGQVAFSTVRFYTWHPPALSIGRLQRIPTSFDPAQCRKLGLDWVRRPTGGRMVLHRGDLTYAVIFAEPNPVIPKGILPSYRKISQAIQVGLKALGVQTQLYRENRNRHEQRIQRSPLCFSVKARHEILVGGKKIMGNAQRRQKGCVLHQGSIMIENQSSLVHQVFSDLDTSPGANLPITGEDTFISLDEVLGGSVSPAQVRQALIKGFEEAWHISLRPGSLTAWEEQEAARLYREKYSRNRWNKEGLL